jgi:8-oxo-dGTP pyrophosphatase MutT (NUDIX family)
MKTENPWQTLSSLVVYENPWISVRQDQIINPSGNPGIYGVVSFKNWAIGIIPLDESLNTWLVGQHRYSLNEYSWEIPMGGGKTGDDILESAQRELREETGLLARDWQQILKLHTSNSVTDETGFVFVARGLTQSQSQPDETEQLQVQKMPLSQAVEMALNGQITDAISVAGLLKAAHLYL